MIRFSDDKVKLLYKLMIEATGGSFGIRDEGLLNSALDGIFQTFDGKELYPTKEEKGAMLGYSLISNHAFVDGFLHRTHNQGRAQLLDEVVAVLDGFGEVVPGVDMQQGERDFGRIEGLVGQIGQDDGVFTA